MDKIISRFFGRIDDDLVITSRGIAYQSNMSSIDYGNEYFDKIKGYRGSEIASLIHHYRVEMVDYYSGGDPVLDVGIGAGEFIESRPNTFGFDVNPKAVEWLKSENKYREDFENFQNFTFWDVIEHIPEPEKYFERIHGFLFASIPVFKDLSKIRESKHYRPNEHLYYFTEKGFVEWMKLHGFRCIERNENETLAGRESIMSFAFLKDLPSYKEQPFFSKWMQ